MDSSLTHTQHSQDGQERAIRESLDLCPSSKLMWSTDGHWFPETFLLAVIQIREALEMVLSEYIQRGALTAVQAIRMVEDLFFHTANKIYGLGLHMTFFDETVILNTKSIGQNPSTQNIDFFQQFVQDNASIKFLQLHWLDYTSTSRVRILPLAQALKMFQQSKHIGITKAALGLLQNDTPVEGFVATGEYILVPILSSLRRSCRPTHATVQCEFREENGMEVPIDPRTLLRQQIEKARTMGISLLVGFEIEIVFIRRDIENGQLVWGQGSIGAEGGHAWSANRALHDSSIIGVLERTVLNLEKAGIELLQFHPETAPGQVGHPRYYQTVSRASSSNCRETTKALTL